MGCYNNQAYFKSREGHGSFVPLCGLLKAEDFDNGSTGGSSPASIQVNFDCNYSLLISIFILASIQSYEIKSPPWTILWFRILGIFSVENIKRLCVFMFQT